METTVGRARQRTEQRRQRRIRQSGTAAERLRAWEAATAATHAEPAAPLCAAAGLLSGPWDVFEAEVVRLLPGDHALVRAAAGTQEISLVLVAAQPGDTVLIHAGTAVGVL
ncbi:conserved hypothetical protein [Frankia canadensis]|uniref:Uncharacterized protein n=1 Tax=Frankia canadensis TaxID=1836972 RepID=A0A2I2L0X4_9ACTN|nr:HypC/HybG/HupF family hydrogenase formation chaperone [Frankia canadensis]SNQ51582.1 conserved hypothetical protein [Frankia canadensis]SOU58872.1 conserved hypothetical protein [Frankia canadensis]